MVQVEQVRKVAQPLQVRMELQILVMVVEEAVLPVYRLEQVEQVVQVLLSFPFISNFMVTYDTF
jgi:hypothetical protein